MLPLFRWFRGNNFVSVMSLPPEAAIKAPIAGLTEGRRNLQGVPRDGAPSSSLALLVICITALPLGCLLALNVSRDAVVAFNWPWMSWNAWNANAPGAPESRPDPPPRAMLSRSSFASSWVQTAALDPASAPSTPREMEAAAREGELDEITAAGGEGVLPLADLASLSQSHPHP